MDSPRLSIIIATWNAGSTLERCLASVVGQSFREWELLISDGGSTDDTMAVVERHSRNVAWTRSGEDKGIYDAWNLALEHAKGHYVCFLGADDALHSPHALQEIFASIGNVDYDLVTLRGQLRDGGWNAKQVFGSSWMASGLPRHMNICHPGMLHRLTLFKKYGLFDTSYKVAADLDFLLRLPNSLRALHIPQVAVDVQDEGISRSRFWLRIKERRQVHASLTGVGPVKAWLYWADKAWRRPIALLLGLPH